jgi:hypothetical protein
MEKNRDCNMAIGGYMKYIPLFIVFSILMFSFVSANESITDDEKKDILFTSYTQAYWEAYLENQMGILPKKSCGWIAYRTWELGTEKGIDVDAVWVCKMDRYHSHIIPVVQLTNGVYYGYQPSYLPFDYYSNNYFGRQEILDTWDFHIVDPKTGSSWPVNISYKDKQGRIYIKAFKVSEN